MIASVVSISAGASLGALLRWLLAGRFNAVFPELPLGTLAANLTGGYLIGVAVARVRRAARPLAAGAIVRHHRIPGRTHHLLHFLGRSGHPVAAGAPVLGAGSHVRAPARVFGLHGAGHRHRELAARLTRPRQALACSRWPAVRLVHGQHLVDALAVEIDHLEQPVAAFDALAHGGQAARYRHQQARHGVVAALVLLGQVADVQPRLELADRHQAVEQPGAVVAPGGPGVGLRAGLQLAGDRFEQVVRRHQPLHHAVFVDHEHDAPRLLAELLEQFHARQRLGHEQRRQRLQFHAGVVLGPERQQPRHADHAQHVVERTAAHRIPGMRALAAHLPQALADAQGRVQPMDIGTRHHHRGQRPVVQMEHVLHHLVLLLLDDAGVHTLLQAVRDLLLGHAAHAFGVDGQHLQHRLGRCRQQFDERPGRPGQPCHGPCQQARDRFRIELADALGHQLAEDDGDVGDQGHDNPGGRERGGANSDPQAVQPLRQLVAERGLADDAVQHADRRDAHLHRGQEAGRLLHQLERGRGARVPGLGHGGKSRLAAGRQRHLRHGEHRRSAPSAARSAGFPSIRGENRTPWHFT